MIRALNNSVLCSIQKLKFIHSNKLFCGVTNNNTSSLIEAQFLANLNNVFTLPQLAWFVPGNFWLQERAE
jgi:hypothetical protein